MRSNTDTCLDRDGWQGSRARHRLIAATCALVVASVALAGSAHSKGGPLIPGLPGTGFGLITPTPAPIVPFPTFSTGLENIHGFDITGFIQNATVSGARCPAITDKSQWGGTLTVNGLTITVPCNMTLQLPAATFTWADMLDPTKFTTTGTPGILKLNSSGSGPGTSGSPFPSIEVVVTGNIVNGEYIAGLLLVSQQSLNTSVGYITSIDYTNGAFLVSGSPTGTATSYVQINDPTARFSIGKSPDSRFSVDDQNPTIHAATGYPMCIPRTDPRLADDPKCPQRNRPLANQQHCRNFRDAGYILPAGRDLAAPTAGQTYCSSFVMPAALSPTNPSTGPNAYHQAPFEVGDFVTFSGTLMRGQGPNGADFISAHTIDANVGIFTQPGTMPTYISIGQFGVGADAPATFNGIPQEAKDRIFLEASVTDIISIVDVYFMDVDPASGNITNRWITPATMTGGTGAVGSNGAMISGGITTQFVGPQPGRARIRANRATPGILLSPTRYVRVVTRSLCDPANINGKAPALSGGASMDCLKRAKAANDLYSGQYFAPTFEFIFPENVVAGDPPVPYNFWALNFLVSGEGTGAGPLIPKPW
jgi:hypothetical protein